MRIKLLFFVCLLIVVGCQNNERDEKILEARKEAKKMKEYDDTGLIREIRTFEYQDHEYVSFEGYSIDAGFAVVHSPSCKYCN